ncbi:hypothetical protein [Novosphingobium sp. MBES04]|uniref:hypothetical protein n=1 Tax=Novosphingobium sp. MBES04 TaxID=1206458 RepID=UPI000723415B|nr:hypothetical protein [Novosphingobium sp. MBES04]GAM04272.1 hypothetical protein MBENS4_1270 [Novosphingobium sp. MBES04]
MSVTVSPDDLDLARYLRRGDSIVIGQACGEPTTLVEALLEQASAIGDLKVFIATSFSGLFRPERSQAIALSSMGAIGALRAMSKANRLSVIPVHVGRSAR